MDERETVRSVLDLDCVLRVPGGRGCVCRLACRIAALVAAGVVLTGCGSGPSQVGAAAIVGSTVISLSDVQHLVDEDLSKAVLLRQLQAEGAEPADIARTVVSQAIQHVLLAQAARREAIAVGDDRVDAEVARRGGIDALATTTIYDAATVREAVRDYLVAQALARKLIGGLSVTVDLTSAGSWDEALAKARRMAAGPRQAAEVFAEDGFKAQRDLQLRAALIPRSAAQFWFGTPAGTVVVAQTGPAPDGWIVLRVTSRRTDAPPIDDPRAPSVSALDAEALDDIGRRLTEPLALELGVRVNPRYGSWDPLGLDVLEPGEPAGVLLPAVLN
ncbi:MAG: SurA N-terminal domain-containing protein [Pseudonocardia sp.]|nr:SurA N-terminal domain-containing protein [Pseudonocardia sp.]